MSRRLDALGVRRRSCHMITLPFYSRSSCACKHMAHTHYISHKRLSIRGFRYALKQNSITVYVHSCDCSGRTPSNCSPRHPAIKMQKNIVRDTDDTQTAQLPRKVKRQPSGASPPITGHHVYHPACRHITSWICRWCLMPIVANKSILSS